MISPVIEHVLGRGILCITQLQEIRDVCWITLCSDSLLCGCRVLKDRRVLGDYGITNTASVQIRSRLRLLGGG